MVPNFDQEVFMYLEMRIGFLGISLYVDYLWLDHFYQDLAKQHVQWKFCLMRYCRGTTRSCTGLGCGECVDITHSRGLMASAPRNCSALHALWKVPCCRSLFCFFSVAMCDIAVMLLVLCFYNVFCMCCSCSCGGVHLLVLHQRFCSSVLDGVSMDGFGLF